MSGEKAPGRIFTFYSYKGGTGRSMLVANTGWLLANAGYDVLMVDWDLEAPGLHRYMAPFLTDPQMTDSNGLIDLVISYATEAVQPSESPRPPEWYRDRADVLDYAVSINWKYDSGGSLSLLPAGRQGSAYATKVNSFSWQNFYDRLGGFGFLEALKDSMRANFDFILVDSRTGVSDTAGISTVQFADSLVVCFTLNNQSIEGAAAVAKSVRDQKQSPSFRVLPVPTRLDNSESEKLLDRWQLAKDRFTELLPPGHTSRYWDDFGILYVPKFAYEEVLAVFGNRPDDPVNLNLLAHAKRLTEALAEVPIPLQTMDESIRSNVLAHFAGKAVSLSPMEAQKKADEEQKRVEEEHKKLEAEQATRIAAARSEGKQEVEEVLAATVRRQRRAVVVGLILVIAVAVGLRVYNQRRISVAQESIRVGDQARLEMRWDDALTEYGKAMEGITGDASLYAKRADILIRLEKPGEALKDLDKAVELNADDLDLREVRARTRMAARNYTGAIEDLSLIASRNSGETSVLPLLADAYQQNNQFKDAIDVYSKLVDQFPGPGDQDELLRRADLYLKVNDRESAIKDFRRVADSTANSPSSVFAQEQLKALGIRPAPVRPPSPVRTVVYIQYADDAGKELIEDLRLSLQKAGFQSPAGEAKSVKTNGEIRYFHREDADRAKRVKEVVELDLAKRRYLVSLALQPIDSKEFSSVPIGQLEVWLPSLRGYDIQQRAIPPEKTAPSSRK